MSTSYTRHTGDYIYDIYVDDDPSPKGFCAHVINMVRMESGVSVSINAELQDQFGATRNEAVSKIEAAVVRVGEGSNPDGAFVRGDA